LDDADPGAGLARTLPETTSTPRGESPLRWHKEPPPPAPASRPAFVAGFPARRAKPYHSGNGIYNAADARLAERVRTLQGRSLTMSREKVTISTLREKMSNGEPITMLTCYDYPTALLEDKAGIDIILVGDSLAMTVLGYDGTLPATMDMMVTHAQAVRRGAPNAFLIGDMPYMSYQADVSEAIRNAGRFMAEAGCDAIKLEGGRTVAKTIRALTDATIPVMGHLGLTPQALAQLGGFKAQGRDAQTAKRVIEDAKILEEAGAAMILLEAVPPDVSKIVAERASVPIIGIGSGLHCHGQLLIVHDMLGFFEAFTPRFVKKYVDLNSAILKAFEDYRDDVVSRRFPEPKHCYGMKKGEQEKLVKMLKDA